MLKVNIRIDVKVINIYKDVFSLLKTFRSVARKREQLDYVRLTEKGERCPLLGGARICVLKCYS